MELSEKEMKHLQSPLKRIETRYYRFRIFERMLRGKGIDLHGGVMLDAGCGAGYTTELLHERYRPSELHAFDLTPEQVEAALRRDVPANLFVGDIAATGFPPDKFDAVVVQGVLHHVSDWRGAVSEVSRVLKPGGVLLLEEPNRRFLDLVERFLGIHHPDDARFDWAQLEEALADAGLSVLESRSQLLEAGMWRSYLCVKEVAYS